MAAPTFAASPLRIQAHKRPINAITYGQGDYLLTGSSDSNIKLFSSSTGRELKTYQAGYDVLDLAVSGDNSTFASVGNHLSIFLWDVHTGSTTKSYNGHQGRVDTCAFGAEDNVLFTGSVDGTVKAWDLRSRDFKPIITFDDARDAVTSVAVIGTEIYAGSGDGRVRIYDLRSGEVNVDVLGTKETHVTSVAPSADGQGYLVSTQDSTMRFMDRLNGRCLQTFRDDELQNTDYRVRSTLAMGDSLAVSGTEDGGVFAWDVLSGQLRQKLWHREGGANALGDSATKKSVVSAVAWNESGKQLASAGGDGKVCVWRSKV